MNNKNNELATKWYPDTLIGLAVIAIYFITNIIFYIVAITIMPTKTMLLFSNQVFSIILMISLFNIQKKILYPGMGFKGIFSWHDYRVCLYIFIAVSFLVMLFSLIFNIPDETFLEDILENKTNFDVLIICLSIIILAPVLEELLFRHFILAMFPFNLGGKWTVYAIVFSAFVFSLAHTQYAYTISSIFIFIIGVILALSRIVSQGLLLPILLHASFNFISLAWYFLFVR